MVAIAERIAIVSNEREAGLRMARVGKTGVLAESKHCIVSAKRDWRSRVSETAAPHRVIDCESACARFPIAADRHRGDDNRAGQDVADV